MPLAHRASINSIAGVLWNIYLSSKANKSTEASSQAGVDTAGPVDGTISSRGEFSVANTGGTDRHSWQTLSYNPQPMRDSSAGPTGVFVVPALASRLPGYQVYK